MTSIGERLVASVIRLYPSSFREQFGDEMLSAFLDGRDALAAWGRATTLVRARHTVGTVVGLLRALPAVRMEDRHRFHLLVPHPRPVPHMQQIATDVRHALRVLRKNPAFASVAVLTLALGIGANTAVFSVLNSVILSPLPYERPEQLVRIYTAARDRPNERNFNTGLDLLEVRDRVTAFSSVAMMYTYRETGRDLVGRDGIARRITVLPVSADYFSTLGASPLFGRTFRRDEELPTARVVLLSHGFWRDVAGGRREIVGERIDLNGESYEVVGVMRPSLTDVVAGDVAAWIPQDLRRADGTNSAPNNPYNQYLSAVARLRPGVSVAQAQSQIDAIMPGMRERYGKNYDQRLMRVVPFHDDVVGEARSAVFILMGAAGLVLLIACVNVANLFLVRSVSQAREVAIRTALGANRARLVTQRLTECLVVAAAGGIVGSVVAYGGVRLLLAVSPASLARAEEVGVDPRLMGFAIAITAVTGLLFGAWPAVRGSRADPTVAMRDGSRGSTTGRGGRRARNLLVTVQVSLALMLLTGAGVLVRSFIARQQVDLGIKPANIATFEVHLPLARFDSAARRVAFHQRYLARLQALPGVAHAGATSWLPANGLYHMWSYSTPGADGKPQGTAAQFRIIEGDYLTAFGITLRGGRSFSSGDRLDSPGVALISSSLAKRAHGGSDPIGKQFSWGRRTFTVIGVVSDVANNPVGTETETVYLSHAQYADDRNWALTYVLKTDGHRDEILAAARRELAAIDRALVLHRPRSMDAVLSRHQARDRFTLLLMGIFAAVALSLAAVGVYGVLSYAVTERRHEIGVRMALGARPDQVRVAVLGQGLAVAGLGVAIGLGGAIATSRLLASLVFGVSTRDPLVLAAVTLVLTGAILAAAWVPARRATRVEPLEALQKS